MTAPLLAVAGLRKRFARGGAKFAALDGVDLTIARGETLALVGPSGSGKSTLARIVMRLLDADTGSISFEGRDLLGMRGAQLRATRRNLQMVFQDPLAALNPRATVARVLDDPLRVNALADRSRRPALIDALLDRVGLPRALRDRRIHEVSGGQRQRVAIARALATGPKLIVLDEALSALDVLVRADIVRLLEDLKREQDLAYLLISHDLSLVARIADRIAIMDHGRIVETGDARSVVGRPNSDMGRALVSAVPRLDLNHEGSSAI